MSAMFLHRLARELDRLKRPTMKETDLKRNWGKKRWLWFSEVQIELQLQIDVEAPDVGEPDAVVNS